MKWANDVSEYLLGHGFSQVRFGQDDCAAFSVRKDDVHGCIQYGWNYQEWDENDDTWSNPSEPTLHIWAGLGEADSYAFAIVNPTVEQVSALLVAVGNGEAK